VSVAVFGALSAWSAHADASASSRLVYARGPGAESCPDEAAFRREVAARLGYDPFFPYGARTISVELEVVDGHSHARIVIVDDSGLERGAQTIDGGRDPASCAALVRGAALAVSVSLEAAPPVVADPPPADPPPQPPLAIEAVVSPVVIPPARAEVLPLRVAPQPRRRTSLFLTPQLWLGYGQWPVVTAGVGAALEVRRGILGIAAEGRWDAPSTVDVGPNEPAQLQRATGSVVPCAHVGVLALCAVGSFGATWASGVNLLDSKSASSFYAAFGGRVGLDVALGRRLRWNLVAEVDGIATPMHLRVGPTTTLDSSPVAASVGTGLATSIF
jgi:hypothetical protein